MSTNLPSIEDFTNPDIVSDTIRRRQSNIQSATRDLDKTLTDAMATVIGSRQALQDTLRETSSLQERNFQEALNALERKQAIAGNPKIFTRVASFLGFDEYNPAVQEARIQSAQTNIAMAGQRAETARQVVDNQIQAIQAGVATATKKRELEVSGLDVMAKSMGLVQQNEKMTDERTLRRITSATDADIAKWLKGDVPAELQGAIGWIAAESLQRQSKQLGITSQQLAVSTQRMNLNVLERERALSGQTPQQLQEGIEKGTLPRGVTKEDATSELSRRESRAVSLASAKTALEASNFQLANAQIGRFLTQDSTATELRSMLEKAQADPNKRIKVEGLDISEQAIASALTAREKSNRQAAIEEGEARLKLVGMVELDSTYQTKVSNAAYAFNPGGYIDPANPTDKLPRNLQVIDQKANKQLANVAAMPGDTPDQQRTKAELMSKVLEQRNKETDDYLENYKKNLPEAEREAFDQVIKHGRVESLGAAHQAAGNLWQNPNSSILSPFYSNANKLLANKYLELKSEYQEGGTSFRIPARGDKGGQELRLPGTARQVKNEDFVALAYQKAVAEGKKDPELNPQTRFANDAASILVSMVLTNFARREASGNVFKAVINPDTGNFNPIVMSNNGLDFYKLHAYLATETLKSQQAGALKADQSYNDLVTNDIRLSLPAFARQLAQPLSTSDAVMAKILHNNNPMPLLQDRLAYFEQAKTKAFQQAIEAATAPAPSRFAQPNTNPFNPSFGVAAPRTRQPGEPSGMDQFSQDIRKMFEGFGLLTAKEVPTPAPAGSSPPPNMLNTP